MIQRELFVLPEARTNIRTTFGAAGVTYLGLASIVALLCWLRPPMAALTTLLPSSLEMPSLTFLNVADATGGGGSGGNRSRETVHLKTTAVPATRPAPTFAAPAELPPPLDLTPPTAAVPAVTSSIDLGNFDPNRPPTPGPDLGAGINGAGGPGPGGIGSSPTPGGIGSSKGPNAGPGPGGSGGVDRQVVLLQSQKPAYTPEGMLRKIQGPVRMSCEVLATGRVGDCRITQSLDSNRFGLDDEAMKAAKRFVFKPAMRGDMPVPVQINIVIEFTVR